jgi:hypothetical protein
MTILSVQQNVKTLYFIKIYIAKPEGKRLIIKIKNRSFVPYYGLQIIFRTLISNIISGFITVEGEPYYCLMNRQYPY